MVLGIALALFLSIDVLPGFSQTAESVPPADADLTILLKLTDEQVTGVDKIEKMAQSQVERDRESFKGNALGLIQAARRTREMTDTHIGVLLNPEQKELFEGYKNARKRNEELFILKEGLLLTPEQCIQVEQTLDELHKEFAAKRGKGKKSRIGMSGGMRDGMGGRRGGGMRGGGPGGRREPTMVDTMKSQDVKKAKKIKKLLTEEQKEMYKDIRKMQKAEMKQKMQEMREKMRTEINR